MATAPIMPDYCGQKVGLSLTNICAHLDYLVKKGFMDEKHKTFLMHLLYKQTQAMEFVDAYFLKYQQRPSNKASFCGPYTFPTHVTFARPQSMSSDSQVSAPSVRFEDPATDVISTAETSGNVFIKVEETTTSLSASSNGVDSTITSVAELTHSGIVTAVAGMPAHAASTEAAAIASEPVNSGDEYSITTIPQADIKGVDTSVTSPVAHAEMEHAKDPITTVTDAGTKGIEASITASVTTDSVGTPNTTISHAETQGIEAPVSSTVANTETTSIEVPVTPTASVKGVKGNQVVESISDDEDDGFDFFSMPYDREANRSIYDDPPRSIPSKKSSPTAAKSVTDDNPEKFSSFLQRCDQLGIKRAISPAKDTVNAEQPAAQLPEPTVAEIAGVVETSESGVVEQTVKAEETVVESPKSNFTEENTIAEQSKIQISMPPVLESNKPKLVATKVSTEQRGYGGVGVRYITEEGTFTRDGSVEFQTVGMSRGVKPERMVTRHNSGVVVEALHFARGGLTGGGPRGDMKSLRFNAGDRLKIKKMLGNGWYLARKVDGDDEYSTVRIFKMEAGLKIASKTKLTGDTSASASRIVVRAPSPDQDFTWIPPHLRGVDSTTPKVDVKVEPIVRKRYHEILYFDGRSPRLVSETVTAVIN